MAGSMSTRSTASTARKLHTYMWQQQRGDAWHHTAATCECRASVQAVLFVCMMICKAYMQDCTSTQRWQLECLQPWQNNAVVVKPCCCGATPAIYAHLTSSESNLALRVGADRHSSCGSCSTNSSTNESGIANSAHSARYLQHSSSGCVSCWTQRR
jgi:hypothetical protein